MKHLKDNCIVHSIVIFLIITIFDVACASEKFVTSVRKMYVPSANTQEQVTFVDHIIDSFTRTIRSSQEFSFVSMDTVQISLKRVVLSDFAEQIDPGLLYRYNDKVGIDCILFVFVEITRSKFDIVIHAMEFPSGILCDVFRISLKELHEYKIAVDQLFYHLKQIKTKKTNLGFPFFENEYGICLILENFESPAYEPIFKQIKNIYGENNNDQDDRIVFKLVKMDELSGSNCRTGSDIIRKTGAEAALYFSLKNKAFVTLPYQSLDIPAIDLRLPAWPYLNDFSCFDMIWDSDYVSVLTELLFPERIKSKQLLSHLQDKEKNFQKSLLLFATQKLEQYSISQKSQKAYQALALDNCYISLLKFYSATTVESGWTLLNYAGFCQRVGQLDKALGLCQNASDIFAEYNNTFANLCALINKAEIFESLEDLQKAEDNYKQALKLAELDDDEPTIAAVYYRLGRIARQTERDILAWDYLSSCGKLYLELSDSLKATEIFLELGELMCKKANYQKSIEHLQNALTISQAIKDDRSIANSYYNLGQVNLEKGDWETAIIYFKNASDYMEILNDKIEMARTEKKIGDIYKKLEKYNLAQLNFEYAVKLYSQIGKNDPLVENLIEIADIAAMQKKWVKAEQTFERALKITQTDNNNYLSAKVYLKMGLLHISTGDKETAYRELRMATTILEKMDDKDDENVKNLISELKVILESIALEKND